MIHLVLVREKHVVEGISEVSPLELVYLAVITSCEHCIHTVAL